MGLAEVLTVIFITLKIVGSIDWSWWLVLSPMWIGYSLLLMFILAINSIRF